MLLEPSAVDVIKTKVGGARSDTVDRGIRNGWMVEQVVKIRSEFGAE